MSRLLHTVHTTSGSAAASTRLTPVGTLMIWPIGTATFCA